MRHRLLWPLLALGVAALVAVGSHFARPARPDGPLMVFFTGEALGEMEPCNCSGKDAGGLPALGGFLAARGGGHLLLDVGCLGRGARDFELLRLEAVLRGMAALGYDAANIGEHELWLGRETLERHFGLGVPFVSANVATDSGEPVTEAFRTIDRAGRRVAVTGIVQAQGYHVGPGLTVDDPSEALARVLPKMREQTDVIIVLADLNEEAVRALAQRFPEITLLLYRGRNDSQPPERANRTFVASVSGKLRFVGVAELAFAPDGRVEATGVPELLDDRFQPDPAVAEASIAWYKDTVRGKKFDLAQPQPGWRRLTSAQPTADDRFAGSAICKECHVVSWVVWNRSHHAKAMKTLERVGYDYSPECVVCHVVAYGASDGYTTREETPELAAVGCEACHGRGGRHVHSQGRLLGSIVRGGEHACNACHTPEHSRGFVYAQAWPKIAHKEPKKDDEPTRKTNHALPPSPDGAPGRAQRLRR